jgi:hypothetical protein
MLSTAKTPRSPRKEFVSKRKTLGVLGALAVQDHISKYL